MTLNVSQLNFAFGCLYQSLLVVYFPSQTSLIGQLGIVSVRQAPLEIGWRGVRQHEPPSVNPHELQLFSIRGYADLR